MEEYISLIHPSSSRLDDRRWLGRLVLGQDDDCRGRKFFRGVGKDFLLLRLREAMSSMEEGEQVAWATSGREGIMRF